ncbi:MAG: hypothetical protein QHJ73_11540 [Armatimonadota bacterium]|nr:hypothetical protein [Armatimonadota bacterium]
MPFPRFDRARLDVRPLSQRDHDMSLADVLPLDAAVPLLEHPALPRIAERMQQARQRGAAVILMMGAHVIKVGLSRYVIDLMERGLVTHVAMNGAGGIHDYELALVGATTERVARYIRVGQFGLWQETGEINDIVRQGLARGMGYGESLGRHILEHALPHADVSILAAGCRLNLPVTIHAAIGQDIIHEHPNCDGAALGEASYIDFLVFTHSVCALEGGVFLNVGTAVMGPEVYLKALSMARNVARQEGRQICHFTTAVFDLLDLGEDLQAEPPKSDARYYYRPFKTILLRTVQDGGESFYVRGDHTRTIPTLRRLLLG